MRHIDPSLRCTTLNDKYSSDPSIMCMNKDPVYNDQSALLECGSDLRVPHPSCKYDMFEQDVHITVYFDKQCLPSLAIIRAQMSAYVAEARR
ncbi:hypothetical protein FHS96_005140 [Sphingomonas zeicaulis]